jgi:2-polyprenyl-6-methoxyphenol hydroxylase-like FAD-dependent oxidoreductase
MKNAPETQHGPFAKSRYDAIVVGARCAGAATAMLLARAGLRVLALDRQDYGSDTLSTHALMRPAVMQLARWGLLDEVRATGAPLITSTTFHYGAEDVAHVPIDPDPEIPGLVAPRRSVLDRILVDAARKAGAEIVHGATVRGLLRNGNGKVDGVLVEDADGNSRSLHASLIVGADGLGSVVARQAGAEVVRRGRSSTATIYLYAANPAIEGYRWYFGARSAAGLIPTNDGQICVFAAMPSDRFESLRHLDLGMRHAAIVSELSPLGLGEIPISPSSRPRAFRGQCAVVRQAHGAGWLLVGDAGLFRDPLTSHGISDALRDAEGAANAVLADSAAGLLRYQEQRNALAYPVIDATEAICAFDGSVDQLKAHHKRLSAAMKAEAAAMRAHSAGMSSVFPGLQQSVQSGAPRQTRQVTLDKMRIP